MRYKIKDKQLEIIPATIHLLLTYSLFPRRRAAAGKQQPS
jgi:hypothetical protein